ncbi:MAG: methyltransferase domain-containing protein [Bacteroidetes bacterium]|nr:methyltransferase domain-containing protein [Bacteroidota bacterium]
MIYKVNKSDEFKKKNLLNWYDNTNFWLESKMRHLIDVYDFTGEQIELLSKSIKRNRKPTLIDFGCGEGWILRLLLERELKLSYIGLDFNEKFIKHLNSKYSGQKNVEFRCLDFENKPPKDLLGKADIGINFFNFFEIPDIESAFTNVASMIKPNSYLLIVSIDPIMQILSVSNSEKDFIKNLELYEKYGTKLGYDKDIDIGDMKSNRVYKSLLYSTATYVSLAKQNNLQLFDFKEIVKTGNTVPQIYQFIFFKKQ